MRQEREKRNRNEKGETGMREKEHECERRDRNERGETGKKKGQELERKDWN
jgi:hypothetical protein